MSEFDAWNAFRKGELIEQGGGPCCECGGHADGDIVFVDDGALLCDECHRADLASQAARDDAAALEAAQRCESNLAQSGDGNPD